MAKTNNPQKQVINQVFSTLLLVTSITLIALGALGWWASTFATNMVKTELGAQKIYFPEKGSPALDPKIYPDLQQYAGELVDTGPEAKAYANGYIGRHLKNIAGGKVYAEVSAEARKDPTNQTLQQQRETLFQGETLRGMLLGNGYAFWTFGMIARYAAIVSFVGGAILGLLAIFMARRR
jgi:hypothetical protein